MAEAVTSVALSTFRDLLLEEARFLIGVRREVRTLENVLKDTKALLIDAKRQQHDTETVRSWLKQVRDLAYRAEDAISLYATIKVSSRISLLRRCSCILKGSFSLHQIASEVKEIKSEIARVNTSMQNYGLKSIIQGESSADGSERRWQTFPFDTEVFVGKEEEVEQLVSHIVGDEEHPVISLWGMGGIGKTTIARKVYNHPSTRRSFESFAWVCISQKCDSKSVLEDVMTQLSPIHNGSDLSLPELTRQLFQVQQVKKCMLVVDDIWSTHHWEHLKHAFNPKTKILLTTRIYSVAKIGFAIKAGLLSDDEGWELLKKKASTHMNFPNFQSEENNMLEKIGREMVGKCGNLPLAVSLLGGILSNKKSSKEWGLVNENITALLYRGVENVKDEIQGVLYLSYQDLPYYLKPCFLYMGIYKEDEVITAIDLCLMWIAQGMISRENNSDEVNLVEIAQHYLSELASRSVVEIVCDDPIRGQTTRLCKLHDVVREMCLSVGMEEDFGLQNLDYEGGAFSGFLHASLSRVKTRHLVVNLKSEIKEENNELTVTCNENTTRIVRSLLFINDIHGRSEIEFPEFDLKNFKVLKTLSLSGVNFKGGKLPKAISKLFLLRILSLRDCNFDELPSSVSNLVYLHTLDLWNSRNIWIPNDVLNRMVRLKHLFLPTYHVGFEEIEDYRLMLDGLEQLETLVGFNSLVHQLNSPTKMKNLRHFEGTVHDNQSLSDIIHASCTSWKDLICGGLKIRDGCQFSSADEDVMNFKKLFTLHNLYIFVPIGNLLKELGNQVYTSNLVLLILSDSEILEDPMETLGKLPLLVDLLMSERCFLGEQITCHASAFPRLEKLGIAGLPNLREWKVEKGAMPLVSKMGIHNCPCLEMVPDGFIFLDALKDLHICGMPEVGERVTEGGEDFHKVQHVLSIVVR
ncbi:putative disease resistance protein At1g50180 [Salvia hispanica]|uniref:putative disease resistance protein At1g50180 n=1 Tax=Salvia hispanica TaxID=49212 RepID=UPI0020094984|nr:putative disease resistance protein At1g50180 [Salvia hispanica]